MPAADTLTPSPVLQHFWDLASVNQDDRCNAADALVDLLLSSNKHNNTSINGDSVASTKTQLPGCSQLMSYSITRLVRGLGSGRDAARQGFAAALALLLQRCATTPTVGTPTATSTPAAASTCVAGPSLQSLLELKDQHLSPKGSMKKTEQRDLLLGQAFLYAALAQGGALTAPQDAAAAIEALLCVAQSKPFMRELVMSVVLTVIDCLPPTPTTINTILDNTPTLRTLLTTPPPDAHPETLLLALHLWPMVNTRLTGPTADIPCPLLPENVHTAPPPLAYICATDKAAKLALQHKAQRAAGVFFTPQHLTTLLPVLRATSAAVPRLHSTWPALLALLLPTFVMQRGAAETAPPSSGEDGKGEGRGGVAAPATPGRTGDAAHTTTAKSRHGGGLDMVSSNGGGGVEDGVLLRGALESLWMVLVEGDLLNSPSHERKFLALQLFGMLLPHLPPDCVGVLFSSQLLHCLQVNLKNPSSHLHGMAKRCLSGMTSALTRQQDNPAARAAIAVALQRSGGGVLQALNKATKGTTAPLLTQLDTAALEQYVQQLHDELVASASHVNGDQHHGQRTTAHADDQKAGTDDVKDNNSDDNDDNDKEEGPAETTTAGAWVVEQLYAVLRMPAADVALRRRVLEMLVVNGLFAADKVVKTPAIASAIIPNLPLTLRVLCTARALSALDTAAKAHAAKQHPKQQQRGQKAVKPLVNTPANPVTVSEEQEPLETMCTAIMQLVNAKKNHHVFPAPTHAVNVEQVNDVTSTLTMLQGLIDTCTTTAIPQHAARAATLTRLLRWLQLYTLADPQLVEGGLLTELTAVVNALGDSDAEGEVAVGKKRAAGSSGGGGEGGVKKNTSSKRARTARASSPSSSSEEEEEDEEEEEENNADGTDEEEEQPQQESVWQDQLVDVVLSLLSYNGAPPEGSSGVSGLPSAPLRDAVERVFRAHCRVLTVQGLEDLLRVVGQEPGGGDDVLQAGNDEEEEEEEDMDVDEEEEDSDEEEEEENTPTATPMQVDSTKKNTQHKKNTQQNITNNDDDDDDSDDKDDDNTANDTDDDDDGMDDDAMFRMDDKLAAYFRAMQRGGTAAKQLASSLLNLRLRVVALLEEYAKRNGHSSLLPSMLPTLLEALRRAQRNPTHAQLAARIHALIVDRICKSQPRDVASSVSADDYAALLKRLLYFASRTQALGSTHSLIHGRHTHNTKSGGGGAQDGGDDNKSIGGGGSGGGGQQQQHEAGLRVQLSSAATAAFEFAVRAGLRGGRAEEARAACAHALHDMLHNKRSTLSVAFFTSLVHNSPDACLPYITSLVQATRTGRNATVRLHALQLLGVLLKQHKAYTGDVQAAVQPLLIPLGKAAVTVLNTTECTQQRYAEMLKALCTCIDALGKLFPQQDPASVLCKGSKQGLRSALDAATNRPGNSTKVDALLQRLAEMLEKKQ